MVNYVTPDNPQVKEDLRKLKQDLEDKHTLISSNFYQFDMLSRLKSFNFSYYDYRLGKWDLPFYKISSAISSTKARDNKKIPFILSEFHEVKEKILNLHKTGIEILNNILLKNKLSISAIKNDLGISEKEARKQVENFRKLNYFKTRTNPNYVFGLSNLVLFLSRDPAEQMQLHKQLSVFPELYSQKYISEEEEGLQFIIRIPNEMIFDSMSLFNKYFQKEVKEMFVINQMYSRRWLLPTERYETVFQEWKYDSADILGNEI